jgi:hypothetical protein
MNSYLSTLVARALEQPQPIRPRLASLFEPLPGPQVVFRESSINERRVPNAKRSTEPALIPAVRPVTTRSENQIEKDPIVPSAAIRSEPRAKNSKSFSESVTPAEIVSPQPPQVADTLAGKPWIEPAVVGKKKQTEDGRIDFEAGQHAESPIRIDQSIHLAQTTVVEQVTTALPTTVEVAAAEKPLPDADHREAVVVKPKVSADLSETQWIEPDFTAPDPAPSVRIMIGRVDVRAIMPPPPATATKSAPGKALSLDAYLKERSGEPR